MTRRMARPTTTTSRPAAAAASAIERMRPTLEAKVVKATLPLALADDLGELAADLRLARAACRRACALVESQTSASTPSSPISRSRFASVGGPIDRRLVDLPVAGMEDRPAGVRIASAFDSGIEWATLIELDVERAEGEAACPARRRSPGSTSSPGSLARLAASRPAVKAVA